MPVLTMLVSQPYLLFISGKLMYLNCYIFWKFPPVLQVISHPLSHSKHSHSSAYCWLLYPILLPTPRLTASTDVTLFSSSLKVPWLCCRSWSSMTTWSGSGESGSACTKTTSSRCSWSRARWSGATGRTLWPETSLQSTGPPSWVIYLVVTDGS